MEGSKGSGFTVTIEGPTLVTVLHKGTQLQQETLVSVRFPYCGHRFARPYFYFHVLSVCFALLSLPMENGVLLTT
jgi:hypothetical protein